MYYCLILALCIIARTSLSFITKKLKLIKWESMKDSDQVLNANQENITFLLQIPLSQKKIKAHSILVLRLKKKEKKKKASKVEK